MESSATTVSGGRSALRRSPASRLPDQLLRWGLTGLAGLILLILLYFFIRLIGESGSTFSKFGLSFVFGNDWDTGHEIFHGFPLLFGTLLTSVIALILGVPVAIAAALYLTELCPRRLRGPFSLFVDLLAAVPSVVYGLWGVFVLIPKLLGAEKWFASTFSFIPFVGGGTPTGPNYFIAGLILAIMIVPIVSAIAREVMATVPPEHKEAALALGATRWEMIRMAVLPYARPGITGGAMLGLGRALGETIAVVLVIGNSDSIGSHLFNQGYSLAAVIANEFGEAANDTTHRSALFAAGLVLFVLTLLVNMVARRFISRGQRGRRGTGGTGVTVATGPAGGAQ
ncbi:MAG: phosphate ABC transporter permease subunit PstC [Solirubrobacterales bacterium]|nr:phosphate ABC transporter permease subunit PstC [Solirubrobacterales bacterium]